MHLDDVLAIACGDREQAQHAHAAAAYVRARALGRFRDQVWHMTAITQFQQGHFAGCLDALAHYPPDENMDVTHYEALALAARSHWRRAREHIEHALLSHPRSRELWLERARLSARLGHWTSAAWSALKALMSLFTNARLL